MRFKPIDAPAHWASLLINNDNSGLNHRDLAEIRAWLDSEAIDLHAFSGCEDEPFFTTFDFPEDGPLGCECVTYTYIVRD